MVIKNKLYCTTIGGIRKNARLFYDLRGLCLMLKPKFLCRHQSQAILREYESLDTEERAYVEDRVSYYCNLNPSDCSPLANDFPTLSDNNFRKSDKEYKSELARRKHRLAGPLPFFYDSYEYTRCFPQHLHWNIEGGDVRSEMSVPTITKSRLIPEPGKSSRNVLLNLNRIRHFVFFNDPFSWEEKLKKVIFRGVVAYKPNRQKFIDMWQNHPDCDVKDACDMTLYEHLKFRYIMALEGNDVASNLKWIMSSNCIAVMPKPTCETWFMEGRLIPDYHYIEIAPDYHDLMEKIDYYESHPEAAKAIIQNAHAWVEQFKKTKRERMISLMVMERYLKAIN